MPTTAQEKKEEEKTVSREQELKELLGSAAVAALKTKPGMKGLCASCSNREICRKRKPGELVTSCDSHRAGPPISAQAFKSFEEVLDFAMEREEKTYSYYDEMAKSMRQPSTRNALKSLARRSLKHRKRLSKMKRDGDLTIAPKNIRSLQITRYITRGAEPHKDMGTREVLMLAIRATSITQNLYADLAAHADDAKIQAVFAALAQEEAELKLQLETEYDEHVFAQD
jgi:rubrerythrin